MKNFRKHASIAMLFITPLAGAHKSQNTILNCKAVHSMGGEKIEMMQSHITEMEQLLELARQEGDLRKRQEMLLDHAVSMGEVGKVIRKEMDNTGGCQGKKMLDAKNISSAQKMESMKKRMAMMEKIMRQMMRHTTEEAKKHGHMNMN